MRTRFSDDRLWLVYATLEHAAATGDAAIFDESVPFLEGRPSAVPRHEAQERCARRSAPTIYDHCVRAIALNLANGEHGLPLMGTGDWNDGMSLVGAKVKARAWLGWFLYSILGPFAALAASRGDGDRAAQYRAREHARRGARGRLGRRLVSPRLLRRWHAARVEEQPGMPHRLAAQSWSVMSARRAKERARQPRAPPTRTWWAARTAPCCC